MAKKMRSVKVQPIQETYSRKDYRTWMKDVSPAGQGDQSPESPRANPDNLSEEDSVYFVREIDEEVQGRVRKLLELSKQILTEQQYHVFILMAVNDPHLTVREVAKVMSLSSARVGQLWQAARKKLEKAYETRTV